MKRLLASAAVAVGFALGAALAAVGAFALVGLGARYPAASRAKPIEGVVRGAYHVHSTMSDGSGTLAQIAEAAAAAGLQFVIVTDHNPLRVSAPRRARNGVLVIEGAELSTNWGHVISLGAERLPTEDELQVDPIAAIQAAKGYAALAHPVQDRNGWTGPWALAERADLFELYSGDTMFRHALDAPFGVLLPAAGAYLTNPRHALTLFSGADREAVQRLFQLSQAKPMATVCAHDAHGLPDYREMFEQMALYLPLSDRVALPDDPAEAASWVIRQLVQASGYCVFRSLGEGAGFNLGPLSTSRRAQVGQSLEVQLPGGTPLAEAQVRCYGACEVQPDGKTVLLKAKGPVHLEVWRRAPGRLLGAEWRPWIVPSPVLVDD